MTGASSPRQHDPQVEVEDHAVGMDQATGMGDHVVEDLLRLTQDRDPRATNSPTRWSAIIPFPVGATSFQSSPT